MIPVDDLVGLKVLVTGASSGIGAAAARALSRSGAEVCLHYHTGKDPAEALADELRMAGGKAFTVSGDVSKADDAALIVEQAVSAMGGLDCLVNNAGAIGRTPAAGFDEAVYEQVFDLNTPVDPENGGPCRTGAEAKPTGVDHQSWLDCRSQWRAAGSGIYAAAKAAVHSLTRALAKELAADGIRVNALAPGVIETPFHDETPLCHAERGAERHPARASGYG